MQTRTKTILLFFFAILIAVAFGVLLRSTLITIESDAYLTPIPWSTLSEYHPKRPITNQFDATVEATQMIGTLDANFPHGIPKVVSAEYMPLSEAWANIGQAGNFDGRPNDTQVWLVTFVGSWQLVAPGGEALAEEYGCIYVILDSQKYEHTFLNARKCVSQ